MDSAVLLSRNGAFSLQARNCIEAIAHFNWSLLGVLHLAVYMQHCEPDATNTEKYSKQTMPQFQKNLVVSPRFLYKERSKIHLAWSLNGALVVQTTEASGY